MENNGKNWTVTLYAHRDNCPEDGTNPQDKTYETVINFSFMLLLSVRGGGRGLLVPREDDYRLIGCGPSGGGSVVPCF